MTEQEQKAFTAMREALEQALRGMSAAIFGTDTYKVSSRGDFASKVEKQIQDALSAANAVQPDFSDQATIAGLEASIGHLSALVNEQLLLLEEVNDNLGVDGLGAELDDDQSPTIAKVRAHLAVMAPPTRPVVQPQAQGEAIPHSGADENPPVFGRRWKIAEDGFGLQRDDLNGRYVDIDDALSVLHATQHQATELQAQGETVKLYDKAQIEKAVSVLVNVATYGSNSKCQDGSPTPNRLLQLESAKYLHSLVSNEEFEVEHAFVLGHFAAVEESTEPAWRPIESAPKDMGTYLFRSNKVAVQGFRDATGKLCVCIEAGAYGNPPWRLMRRAPTHWMPLPAAPEAP